MNKDNKTSAQCAILLQLIQKKLLAIFRDANGQKF